MSFIYLNYWDLNEEARENLCELAMQEIDIKEVKKECRENARDYDEVIINRVERKLQEFSYEWRYVFNY